MANTIAIPSAGKSFTLSLIDYNNSLQTIWSNFYGPSIPNNGDITILGSTSTPLPGSLYRSSTYNTFYVYDPSRAKGGSLGGGYTRQGIATRNFESISALVTSLPNIEQAELLTTVGDSTANYRVYMKTTNSNSIVDIGVPGPSSLTTGMFINRQIANTHIGINAISTPELAPLAVTNDKVANNAIDIFKIANNSVDGTKLTSNLVYSSQMNVASNLNMGGNVVFVANKGLRFSDGSQQNTAGLINFANVGGGVAFAAYKSANSNLVLKTAGTSLSLTGDSLGTGSFTVTTDGAGKMIWGLTLGTGVGVSVGVGVGVGTGK